MEISVNREAVSLQPLDNVSQSDQCVVVHQIIVPTAHRGYLKARKGKRMQVQADQCLFRSESNLNRPKTSRSHDAYIMANCESNDTEEPDGEDVCIGS